MKTTVVKLAMAALAVCAVICIPSCTKPDNSGETDKPTNPTIPEGVVDLGLSVYWASMNLGATAPEGYGDYYAWAEIEPYYTQGHAQDEVCSDWRTGKTGYNWASYQWCNGGPAATKYCTNEYVGTPDGRTTGRFRQASRSRPTVQTAPRSKTMCSTNPDGRRLPLRVPCSCPTMKPPKKTVTDTITMNLKVNITVLPIMFTEEWSTTIVFLPWKSIRTLVQALSCGIPSGPAPTALQCAS